MNSSFLLVLVAAPIGFFMLFRRFRFQQDNKDTKSSSLTPPSSSLSPTSPPSSSLSLTSPPSSSLSPKSPPSPSLSRIWKHDVFPSFHGKDVRKTILSHILEAFRGKGINTFIDNDIERSKTIGPELVDAIRGSKIAMIMLSRNYASSSWCLDELAEIMKCREEFSQIVMTVFYEVDPTDVKKQTGDFGKAFKRTCKGKSKEHIERWRKSLKDVALIAGEHYCNWNNEATMIQKIATDVSNKLFNSTPSRDFNDLVGMGAHMERLEQLLRLDLDEVRMIGIWGPLGIGKSTIARVLFNQLSIRFQLGTIMVNIKALYSTPCLDEYNAQLQLQSQMLSQIIKQKEIIIPHLGVAQERLKDKKVLLVLEDVDQLGQLNALAKEIQWFGPGSRIIITTEDRGVLKKHGEHGIEHIYKVRFPSSEEALQIFCTHAFGQKHPYVGFNELARKVTSRAGKLPLGLKVMGSALRGMSKEVWEMGLPYLDGEIESIIKFSYDTLPDEEKYLFLYLACLYSFRIPHIVEELLAKQIEGVGQCLKVLVEKSLISIDWRGRIEMHTLLVQFGIKTSREQFIVHGRAKRQLLVGEKDICEVLSDDTTDNRHFIGINLDLFNIKEELDMSEKALETMSNLQFVSIYAGEAPFFETQEIRSERLQSLLSYSQKIRSLYWQKFQNICLPSTFNPEFLVELVMSYSKLQKLWEGTKPLRNLKWMDLSFSTDLKELPDLSTATNLKELNLSYCSNLVELPSIGNATKLEKLDLSNCSSLLELPPSIGTATNLEELNIRGCSSLRKLPSSIGDITNLSWFDLSNCPSLLELPPSIGTATNLWTLNISGCSSLRKLPSSIGDITNLSWFDLSNCSSLLELPPSIGTATNLEELYISGCSSLVKLPSSIGTATNLEELYISGCSNLVKLPSSIGDITNLTIFDLSNCSSLLELPPSIGTATNLEELDISGCSSLVSLPQFSDSLRSIKADNCKCLERLDCSFNNPEIRLTFSNCFRLNQEARDLIMHTSSRAVLPGTQVPACFDYRATEGGPLTIKLNERHLSTSLIFKACIMLVKGKEDTSDYVALMRVHINIMDKQNDLTVSKSGHLIYPPSTEHIYTFKVEAKNVTSTELVFEFKSDIIELLKIGECGLYQILEVPSCL